MHAEHKLEANCKVPEGPAVLVERPRFDFWGSHRLAFVSAPPGYGKTTLVASWMERSGARVAWVSLDASDNEPRSILLHAIAAVQTEYPSFGCEVAALLQSSEHPACEALLSALLNECAALPEPIHLVLDDYHVIRSQCVHDGLAFVIKHHPPQLRPVVLSRTELPITFARLRALGHLLEYGTEDLRFTEEESKTLLNGAMALDLPPCAIDLLRGRTEGWVAGLRLAALSMQSAPDQDAFLCEFAGDDRNIHDFLLSEVLSQQPPEMQHFLLQTSVLDRFCAPLCDALTGRTDSALMIQRLDQGKTFVVCLDNKRHWYRFHHLFGSMLRSTLQHTWPRAWEALHRRAAHWYEPHHLPREAVQHALLAKDYELAADLLEAHGRKMFGRGRVDGVLEWSHSMPAELLARRPELSMLFAWVSFLVHDEEAMQRHLQAVEHCLAGDAAPPGSKERVMLGEVALIKSCQRRFDGDLGEAERYIDEALRAFSPGRMLYRAAAVSRGMCLFVRWQLDEAERLFAECADLRPSKHHMIVEGHAVLGLSRCRVMRGDLHSAEMVYDRAMQQCVSAGGCDSPVYGLLQLGMAEIAYERNELCAAETYLLRGIELTEGMLGHCNAWGRVMLARTRRAMGLPPASPDPLHASDFAKYLANQVIAIQPVNTELLDVWVREGKLHAVQHWADANGLLARGPIRSERQGDYLTLARLLLARSEYATALDLLQQLYSASAKAGCHGMLLKVLVLQALALKESGATGRALDALDRALRVGYASGHVRVFLDEGPSLQSLLERLAIVAGRGSPAACLLEQHLRASAAPRGEEGFPVLLSRKELHVAEQLVKDYSNQEIADLLCLSVNTVKTHIKSIYAKLEVSSRVQAVERLRKLGLF